VWWLVWWCGGVSSLVSRLDKKQEPPRLSSLEGVGKKQEAARVSSLVSRLLPRVSTRQEATGGSPVACPPRVSDSCFHGY
jgi:hypothetical protein